MTDKVSQTRRHEIMSKIRSKNTSIEIKVRHWLYHKGIRYRKNQKNILGSPDISIKKYRIVIFVNGCFWHGHNDCKLSVIPKTNTDFWRKKIQNNINRDAVIVNNLKNDGWNIFVVWECELGKSFEKTMEELYQNIIKIITSINN